MLIILLIKWSYLWLIRSSYKKEEESQSWPAKKWNFKHLVSIKISEPSKISDLRVDDSYGKKNKL